MSMDILEILESSAEEIRSLRASVESNRVMELNRTIRIAVSQMRGNTIRYGGAPTEEWDKVKALAEEGKIVMDHTGEVWLQGEVLTKQVLEQYKGN